MKQYTNELYKKEINGTEDLNLDDYELELDILVSEVKLAMETLANGKAPGHDVFQFNILKQLKKSQ
jgi:hypothetical protein